MWIRAELKARAKTSLEGTWGKAILVSIILGIAGGGGGNFQLPSGIDDPEVILVFLMIMLIALVVGGLFRIFLGAPLVVGAQRYFIDATSKNADLGQLGYAFDGQKYLPVVGAMFIRALLIFLWFFVFIIPGIIKGYAYMMVPYILADNPNIGYKRALELSNKMTYGHKVDIWILGLSFLGWFFASILTLFIGLFFLYPYINATMAELYVTLRQLALEKGYTTYEELNLEKTETLDHSKVELEF